MDPNEHSDQQPNDDWSAEDRPNEMPINEAMSDELLTDEMMTDEMMTDEMLSDETITGDVKTPPVYQRCDDGQYLVKPSLIERALSPQSLQWMMTVGGGMSVIGFVVWLWSIGLFDNPMAVALVMGGGIAALIAAGIAVVKRTRYQLAGTGLTLLGAMAMPLQLWFYHAQGLIDLNAGGHLWIPAAGFCLVYAGIARVLRNPAFVYTLVGGVVLTGMLFLADQTINQFWNLLPQVTFLVSLGWVCVFAEKWFVESDSDFSRAKFGIAFRNAGITSLVGGLFLLLASQIAGVFFSEIELNGYLFPQYVPNFVQQCWAVAILSLTAIGIGVENGRSSFSNHRKTVLVALGVWIAICLVGLLNVTITISGIATVIAAAVLIWNVGSMLTRESDSPSLESSQSLEKRQPVGKSQPLGKSQSQSLGDLDQGKVILAFALCLVALVQVVTQSTGDIDYALLAQLASASLAAISCAYAYAYSFRVGVAGSNQQTAESIDRENVTNNRDSVSAFIAVSGAVTASVTLWAAATMMAASTAIPLLFVVAIVGLALPLALAAGGLLLRGRYGHVTQWTASTMTVSSVVQLGSMATTGTLGGQTDMFWLGVTIAAGLIHYLCSCLARTEHAVAEIGFNRFASYGYLIAAIAISLTLAGMGASMAIVSSPAVVGLLLIVIGTKAIASGVKISKEEITNAEISNENTNSLSEERHHHRWNLVQDYGRIFVMFANAAAILWALNMVSASTTSMSLAVAIAIQSVTAIVACLLSRAEGWKHGFIGSTILLIITECWVVHDFLPFSVATKIELVAVLVGVMLLAIGHLSWSKEDSSQSASTTAALWFGSVMTAGPLMVALFCHRYFPSASIAQFGHEVAVLVTLLSLMAAGILCRIRSTTIVGAAGTVVYIGSLLTMIPLPEKLQSISVVMMVGGAIFFTVAILLSVYRDRIIAIPQRYRQGEGVFQVLKWR